MSSNNLKIYLKILAVMTLLFLTSAVATYAANGQPHVFPMNTDHAAAALRSAASGNLIDNGGPVLESSTSYAIFWGTQTAFPGDLKKALPLYFQGYGDSVYSHILDQYLPGVETSSFDTTTATDTSAPPGGSPSTAMIVNEACKAIKAGRLPLDPIDKTSSSGGLYFVFTSNFPSGVNYCAWHSYGSCEGQNIAVAYIPNLKNVAGCNPGNLYNANTYSEGTRADVNVVAHEQSEAITDPQLNAWFDSVGNEIGDKCAWMFSSAVTLADSTTWQLQEEWSNSATACAQEQTTP
jgi:hypothetical protein